MTGTTSDQPIWADVVPAEIVDNYETWRREPHIGPNPAFVMIDLYNLVYDGGARPVKDIVKEYPMSCGEYAWGAIPHTKSLLEAARRAGIPVVHVTRAERLDIEAPALHAKRQRHPLSAESYAIRAEFTPRDNEAIIYKKHPSGFFGTTLDGVLRRLKVDTLILAGETTSGCVRATALDSFQNQFHTVIAEECVFDRTIVSHKVNLFDLHHKYADVMKTAEVVRHLDGMNKRSAAA